MIARHGTRTRYKGGCRCEPCVKVHGAYERTRARRAGVPKPPPLPPVPPPPPVPRPATVGTQPAVMLLRSLVALGHHPRELSEASGLDVPRLLSWQGPALAQWVCDRITGLYADYRWRTGRYPSIAAAAMDRGWAPPGRRPDDEPDPPPGRLDPETLETRVRDLAAVGMSDSQIGQALGVSAREVRRARQRNNIPPGRAARGQAYRNNGRSA